MKSKILFMFKKLKILKKNYIQILTNYFINTID